jgi:hypothetical protein
MYPNTPRVIVAVATIGLLFYAPPTRAHCDTLSGPVVTAAKAALATKDLRPLLKWVKPEAEPELRSVFAQALAVRSQGPAARELADRHFFETVVRLHRAGEGAPYTGLKGEADDPGGLIAASDRALDAQSPDALVRMVTTTVTAGLRERYSRVVETRKHADDSVEAGRKFVEAYVEYVHFVEALQQMVGGGGHAAPAQHDHRH